MKKTLLIILLACAILGLGTYLYKKINTEDYSGPTQAEILQLETVKYKDKEYKTTGGMIPEDKESQESLLQIIELSKSGIITTKEFVIHPSSQGEILVELSKPYTINKALMYKWLRNNGFDKIEESNFKFIEK